MRFDEFLCVALLVRLPVCALGRFDFVNRRLLIAVEQRDLAVAERGLKTAVLLQQALRGSESFGLFTGLALLLPALVVPHLLHLL